MQTLLFFDDWFLDSHRNIKRRMGKPQWVGEAHFMDPGYEMAGYYPSVFWDPGLGRWRAFYISWTKRGPNAPLSSLATAESDDGIHWEAPDLEARFPNQGRTQKNQIFQAGAGTEPGAVYRDERETNPARRYKLLYIPGPSRDYYAGNGVHRFAVSADGYQWQPVEGVTWGDWLSDAPNSIFYNRHRDSYVTPVRPLWGDRRIGLIETRDWQHWTKPEIVVHPDPLDEPLIQYYGMPITPYAGMYVGLLQLMHCDANEIRHDKMRGPLDCELTYSYNGWNFNRSFREPFIPLNEPGEFGSAGIYPGSLCVSPHNVIHIYSHTRTTEHDYHTFDVGNRGLSLHTLRLDGFMYLESTSHLGRVITRPLLFSEPVLKLNVQAPYGEVRVQMSDVNGKPLEGLTFEDCAPLRGDELFWEPQWQSGKGLKDALAQATRVEVQMLRGRLYAIRGEFENTNLMMLMKQRKT